jgi:diguanylate cyclase (GGDEF)-like protein/PAS domain S-box-containing protein
VKIRLPNFGKRPLGARLGILPWLVLATGLGLTGLWCHQQRHFTRLEHERIERDLANAISNAITSRLQTNIAVLNAVVGLFDASKEVDQQEFNAFYQALNHGGETLSGIQGVGYAVVVPNGDISGFEQQVRRAGRPHFTIQPAGSRQLTSAILYLEPNDWRNQRALGFDMYSQVTRREAMQLAVTTGQPALSGPVRLLQENSIRPQIGALLYQAIYRTPSEGFKSSQDRFNHLRGWAYSPLRMEDLIQGALATVDDPALQGTGVLIYDSSRNRAENLLFDNLKLANSPQLTHPTWLEVSIANRTWVIGIQLDYRKLNPEGWSNALLLQALLGLSLSVLAAVISQQLIRNHQSVRQALLREQEASRERALAGTVFDSSPVAIVVTDAQGVILKVNQAFCQLTGYSELEARGNTANLLRSGRHDNSFYEQMWSAILSKGYWSGEIWNRHRNGQIIRHELSITAVLDERQQPSSFVGLLRDVSERYQQEERMRFMATHDQLTGLANRTLLIEELNRSLALAKRQGFGVGLLFIDLNRFKPVNDRFGHSTGDALLKAVAQRLTSTCRSSDTLCRQGGDEFVVLIPDAPSIEHLETLARKLVDALEQPFPAGADLPKVITISASIGIARWPDHASDADALIEAADTAMYVAKLQGEASIAIAASIAPSDTSN